MDSVIQVTCNGGAVYLNYCGFFFLFSGFYFRVKLGEFVCFLRNHEGKQRKVE